MGIFGKVRNDQDLQSHIVIQRGRFRVPELKDMLAHVIAARVNPRGPEPVPDAVWAGANGRGLSGLSDNVLVLAVKE